MFDVHLSRFKAVGAMFHVILFESIIFFETKSDCDAEFVVCLLFFMAPIWDLGLLCKLMKFTVL